MLDKTIKFFGKSMASGFRIYESKLKSIGAKIKNLSLLLSKKIRKILRSFISYVFSKPESIKDYIRAGSILVSKQLVFRVVFIIAAVFFVLSQFAIPYMEGKLWRASLVINTDKYHSFTGKARVYQKDGDLLYIGNIENGEAEGKGEVYSGETLIYKGNMSRSKYNGEGSCYEDENLVYEGNFLNNEYNGEGIYYENGAIAYEGNFLNGEYNGEGKLYYTNGSPKYSGAFMSGVFIEGTEYYENGKIKYIGKYSSGAYSGEGVLYADNSANSIIYSGNFSNGLYDGEGRLYLSSGSLLYDGFFKDGHYSGEGVLYSEKTGKLIYAGGFYSGVYNGQGKLYFEESGRMQYDGLFSNGSYNGYGQLYNEIGKKIFDGEFLDDNINFVYYISKGQEELRQAFGTETELYMLENSYMAYYDSFDIGFELNYTYDDTMPVVDKIKFFGDENISGIHIGMSIKEAKETIGEGVYNEYSFNMTDEDMLFYRLSGFDSMDNNGYILRYIKDETMYFNIYSYFEEGNILYFEIGEM